MTPHQLLAAFPGGAEEAREFIASARANIATRLGPSTLANTDGRCRQVVALLRLALLGLVAIEADTAEREAAIDNRALIDFGRRFRLDGDLLRCVDCNSAIIASRDGEEMLHQSECENVSSKHPWSELRRLLGTPMLVPSDAEREAAMQVWEWRQLAEPFVAMGAMPGALREVVDEALRLMRSPIAAPQWQGAKP